MSADLDEQVLRGRAVSKCYERRVRPEDGEAFLLLAVDGSVKKRGWVREAVADRLFPRVARLARLGTFDVKPPGQKPALPAPGDEATHVVTRLALAAAAPLPPSADVEQTQTQTPPWFAALERRVALLERRLTVHMEPEPEPEPEPERDDGLLELLELSGLLP